MAFRENCFQSNERRAMTKKNTQVEKSYTVKYVAIYLLCAANNQKMLKISYSLCRETNSRSPNDDDDDRNHAIATQATEKKLIVFIVSSNLLMSKIGTSKENQIKKVRSFVFYMSFFSVLLLLLLWSIIK